MDRFKIYNSLRFLSSFLVILTFSCFSQFSVCMGDLWSSGPQKFDFVIVGGGTSGLTLASRLSENPNYSVLVVEKGSFPDEWLSIPAIYSNYLTDDNQKVYHSVPQEELGDTNKIVEYPVAKMLGGCTQHNGMMFNRGSPYDYDNWALITGDDSWSYRNLLKYFKKIENYSGEFQNNADQHGFDGPITISQPKYAPGKKLFLEAGKFLGYPIADPNGPQKVSFCPVEFTKSHGRRVTSYSAYIQPILASRPNLKIVTNAEVTRILFEDNNATGVIYQNPKLSHSVTVLATKEVIISAGVMSSPVILMKSGVGPESDLALAGISLVANLPVGENLQDHFAFGVPVMLNDTSGMLLPERDFTPETFNYFNILGDGPYSSTTGVSAEAFLTSSKSEKNGITDWPDLQITAAFISPFPGIIGAFASVGRPKSRGRLTLNLTDIEADPIIDFRVLSHPDDLEAALELVKYCTQIYEETPAFQALGAKIAASFLSPHCGQTSSDDEFWICYIKSSNQPDGHGAGTNKMGRGVGDPEAVVDSQLRVIGINNLRVVDNSIMPDVTNANTQAVAYVIAEKAADMIKAAWY